MGAVVSLAAFAHCVDLSVSPSPFASFTQPLAKKRTLTICTIQSATKSNKWSNTTYTTQGLRNQGNNLVVIHIYNGKAVCRKELGAERGACPPSPCGTTR